MHAVAILVQGDGLTWTEVVAQVPHDPAAIFIYLLLFASGVAIWLSGRGKKQDRPEGGSADPAERR